VMIHDPDPLSQDPATDVRARRDLELADQHSVPKDQTGWQRLAEDA
jgi:hypothetical protein